MDDGLQQAEIEDLDPPKRHAPRPGSERLGSRRPGAVIGRVRNGVAMAATAAREALSPGVGWGGLTSTFLAGALAGTLLGGSLGPSLTAAIAAGPGGSASADASAGASGEASAEPTETPPPTTYAPGGARTWTSDGEFPIGQIPNLEAFLDRLPAGITRVESRGLEEFSRASGIVVTVEGGVELDLFFDWLQGQLDAGSAPKAAGLLPDGTRFVAVDGWVLRSASHVAGANGRQRTSTTLTMTMLSDSIGADGMPVAIQRPRTELLGCTTAPVPGAIAPLVAALRGAGLHDVEAGLSCGQSSGGTWTVVAPVGPDFAMPLLSLRAAFASAGIAMRSSLDVGASDVLAVMGPSSRLRPTGPDGQRAVVAVTVDPWLPDRFLIRVDIPGADIRSDGTGLVPDPS